MKGNNNLHASHVSCFSLCSALALCEKKNVYIFLIAYWHRAGRVRRKKRKEGSSRIFSLSLFDIKHIDKSKMLRLLMKLCIRYDEKKCIKKEREKKKYFLCAALIAEINQSLWRQSYF
jgi:hypothetical protein